MACVDVVLFIPMAQEVLAFNIDIADWALEPILL